MSENFFKKLKITDEAWNKVKVANVGVRPNSKNAYSTGLNAEQTKEIFDKGPELIKDQFNKLVDYAFEEEGKRISAEAERQNQEEQRQTAESERQTAESARINAENNRDVGERLRISGENQRVEAEVERIRAENERVAREEERDVNEFNRNEAELNRANAEQTRIANETERQNQEKAREEAATAREESFSYLAEPYKVPIRDEHGNIPIDDDESNIENRKAVAVSGLAVYLYVKGLLDALVNGAPGTMDTLKEIADLIGSGDDAATILGRIAKNAKSISDLETLIAEHEGEIAEAEADIVDLSAIVASIKKFCDDLIAQTPGDSESKVMSQKATTKYVKDYVPKVATRNLLNATWQNANIGDDGKFTAVTSGVNFASTPEYIQVTGGETYTLSWIKNSKKVFVYVIEYKADYSCIKKTYLKQTSAVSNFTFQVDAECAYVRFNLWGDYSSYSWEYVIPENLQFELGSTATEYIPPSYIDNSVIDLLGHPDADKFARLVASRNLLRVTWHNANINSSGGYAEITSGVNFVASPDYIPVEGGKYYTFSWVQNSLRVLLYVREYDSNYVFIKENSVIPGTNTSASYITQFDENCAYVRINLWGNYPDKSWEELIPENFQMEEGSTATEYLPLSVINNDDLDIYDLAKRLSVPKLQQKNYSDYGLPILEFDGDISRMNKEVAVTLSYNYGDREGSCELKWQGSSSIQYPKKNYTVKFDTAFEAKEGWGEQKKYCLKANYIDFSHSRNICCAKLWGGVVKSRTPANATLNALPNAGAIDGFPICVVINGEYQGIYTFNIPKDGWMFGMGNEASTEKMAILCADAGDATGVQICTFKSATATGTDADLEIEYVTDEDNSQWVIDSVNRLIQACIDCSSEADFDANVAPYLDLESAIDYYIFCLIARHFDGISKNYLLVTYDGTKWFFSAYDMDSTFGMWFDGSKFTRADGYSVDHFANQHRVFELIKTYKADELKARYNELVNGALSEETVIETFTNFAGSIPKALLDEEVKIWPTLPSTSVNNVSQIIDFYQRRRAYIDPQIEAL